MRRRPAGVRAGHELTREYTLEEIAIVTRAGPARALGLTGKGHLGPGADADVAVYPLNDDRQSMFSSPSHVIKGGKIVVRGGEVVESFSGWAKACPAAGWSSKARWASTQEPA